LLISAVHGNMNSVVNSITPIINLLDSYQTEKQLEKAPNHEHITWSTKFYIFRQVLQYYT